MSTFVTIQARNSADLAVLNALFTGEIRPAVPALVASYALLDLTTTEKVARIENYPRGVESGLTLFSRLIARARSSLLSQPVPRFLTVILRVGPALQASNAVECLHLQCEGQAMSVWMMSCAARTGYARVRRQGDCVHSAVSAGVAAALGWSQPLAPLPVSLADVPIRHDQGNQFVLLSDVPDLTRRYLRLHFHLDPNAVEIAASQWRAFLQELAPRLHQRFIT